MVPEPAEELLVDDGEALLDDVEGGAEELATPALLTVEQPLDLPARIEALLFVADRPLSVAEIAQVLSATRPEVERGLSALHERCGSRGVRLQREGKTVQAVSAPEAAEDVQRFLGLEASTRLSGPALETLAIVAYRQPVTRPEIEELRGVNCDAVLRTLMGRGLVSELGRRDTVGLPIEYGTTFRFLEYFGLASLDDLPPVTSGMAAAPPGAESDQAAGQGADGGAAAPPDAVGDGAAPPDAVGDRAAPPDAVGDGAAPPEADGRERADGAGDDPEDAAAVHEGESAAQAVEQPPSVDPDDA